MEFHEGPQAGHTKEDTKITKQKRQLYVLINLYTPKFREESTKAGFATMDSELISSFPT